MYLCSFFFKFSDENDLTIKSTKKKQDCFNRPAFLSTNKSAVLLYLFHTLKSLSLSLSLSKLRLEVKISSVFCFGPQMTKSAPITLADRDLYDN
jgi:hypothetical protein